MLIIKSIEFFNHIIFGNQKFDFTKHGVPVKNVIIAGENGSGKTKLLEEINKISYYPFLISNSELSNKSTEIIVDISTEDYVDSNGELIDEADLVTIESGNNYVILKNKGNIVQAARKRENNEEVSTFRLSSIYSTVDVNYKPRTNVYSVTNQTLDNDSYNMPDDLAAEIIQLLVDIATQDSHDLDIWFQTNKEFSEEVYRIRTKRFTDAFQNIFEDKIQYKGIKDNTIPIFEKDNHEIEISSLSSGEKQIIFRGVYLLRNQNSLKGLPVLIDEPEISMHPLWEEKIFGYYQNIFSDQSVQTSQIFIATHSEHILSQALDLEDCVIIKMKNYSYESFYKGCSGIILPTITIAEIKYAIFDLYTTDFHSLLYGYIQANLVKDAQGNAIQGADVKQTDKWLKSKGVKLKPYKITLSNSKIRDYETLPSYIRNCIDHPDSSHQYSKAELQTSINELINIIKNP